MPEEMSAAELMGMLSSRQPLGTGSAALDGLLAGGYNPGKIVEFYGKSNTGKTQLGMQAVLMASKRGQRSLFVDSEGTFRPERIEGMARARGWSEEGLLANIAYVRARTAAEQIDAVRAIRERDDTSPSKVVVIDTITRNFTLDFPGGTNLAKRQGALGVHLSDIARDAVLHGRAYVLTNRVTFGRDDEETRIGGSTMEQMVHVSVHLSRDGGLVRAARTSGTGAEARCELSDRGLD